jgi:hypothetical protein
MQGGHVSDVRICGHCEQPMRGMASKGDTWLCHPDEGIDCYRLVTVYGHATPCGSLDADQRFFDAVDEYIVEAGWPDFR